MSIVKRLLSYLYRLGYLLHHRIGLRPQADSTAFKPHIIIVGSYLAGGAGKTPFCIWLAKKILSKKSSTSIAILCHSKAIDEANLIRRALRGFSSVQIFTTRNRFKTAKQIQDQFKYILCDDGFEDSRFVGATIFCLNWGSPPSRTTHLIPCGKTRSLAQDHPNIGLNLQCAGQSPHIQFSIDSVINLRGEALIPNLVNTDKAAVAASAIGDPHRFFADLHSTGIKIASATALKDHSFKIVQVVKKALAHNQPIIITEKDWIKLPKALQQSPLVYTAVQEVKVMPNVEEEILNALSL